jgi:MFS family permease
VTPAAELIEQQTFRLERWRSIAAGITETANATFFGVMVNKYFLGTSQAMKGLLLTNTSIGMLLSPALLWWAAKKGWNTSQGIAMVSCFAALACLLGMADSLVMFMLGGMLSYAAAASVAPLYIAIYEGNYRKETRGKLFAANYFLRIISNILFAYTAGKLLDHHLSWYPVILGCYALCFAFSAWIVSRMPPVTLASRGGRNPLTAMRHVKEDRLFRWTLASWMLLGLANLAMFPLRTEYLANSDPQHGLGLSASDVALYTSVIPNIARLIFNPIWGPVFDRMNFFKLRIILNTGFMLGFLSFFTGGGIAGLVIGAILFGISNAGADVVWNLWVTKIATPDKTAEYMAVHSFLTGVRGVIAPITAYQLTNFFPIWGIATGCALLVVMASALLWKERDSFTKADLPEDLARELE